MPLFEFRCPDCQTHCDINTSYDDLVTPICPSCHKTMARQISLTSRLARGTAVTASETCCQSAERGATPPCAHSGRCSHN